MSSEFNCLDQLNTYAEFLSANPLIGSPRPQPLLWTSANCSGNQILPVTEPFLPSTQQSYDNPYGSAFDSLYLPVGWTVTLQNGNLQRTFPDAGAQNTVPVLISDAANLFYPGSSQSLQNAVTTISFQLPDSLPTWKLQMCNNEISTVVGARHLTSYQTGSLECDSFMTGFCSSCSANNAPTTSPVDYTQVGCAAGTTDPVAVPEACRYCVCLVEENCLKETFCTPGSTDPNCVTNSAFENFIPVTCFGKNCSIEGYRWGRMQNQLCNITLCQQIIRLVGNDIVVKGGSTMWCGNQAVNLSTTPSVGPNPDADSSGLHLPTWAWILIGIGVFVIAIVIPLAVIIWKRSYTANQKPRPLPTAHELTPALPPLGSTTNPEFQSFSTEVL